MPDLRARPRPGTLTMLSKFFDSVTGGVASSWLALVRAPAVIFWGIGAFAWWYSHPHVNVVSWLRKLTGTEQVLLVVVVAAAVIGSSVLLDQLSRPLLRALEGYWPRFLEPARGKLIARSIRLQRDLRAEWTRLGELREGESGQPDLPDPDTVALAAARDQALSRLDAALHSYPADEARTMPTRVGNVLRASETYASERYGLDAIITWPRLWLLLPAGTQQEMVATRRSLDQSVAALVALIAAVVWVFWAWWVVPVAVLIPPLVYRSFVVARAQVLAQLVTAAFDLNRASLYRALRFPLPPDADAELVAGAGVTEYLWRGYPPAGFTFADEQPPAAQG
jgi:hypothetical protein